MANKDDRREFFRIEDTVTIELTRLEHNSSSEQQAKLKDLPQSFQLLNQLHQLDSDNYQLIRAISDKHRDIAEMLRIQNKKIELIGQFVSQQTNQDFNKLSANISGSGISFLSEHSYTEQSRWVLKILLSPENYGFACFARVVESKPVNKLFEVSFEFEDISQRDQDHIVKHITRLQSEQIRKSSQ
ncbi:MAG: PilZ domain-containing protein [Kangiellaceae bacterium]|jgi:c-di-GMP-binding flagellar brake protein YcgR|nr:PilZ domain-containing protein [Kangiellaceae bacterium]